MKTYDEDDINNPRSPRRRGGDSDSDTVSRARLGTDGKGNEIVGTGLRRYIKSSMLIYLRYWFIALWVMAGAAYIVSHAYDTTVTHRQQWMDKANEELQKEVVIPPRRGEILADDGSVLATNLTYYTLRMDMRAASFKEKQFVASLDSLCDSLATMTPGVSSEDWQRRFNRELGKKKGERNRRLTLLRDISYADKERVRTTWPFFHIWSNPNKTGLTIDPREMRSYPYGEMAKRSIGRVGQTKDNSEVHGISGLEKALDKKLFGKPGIARKVPLTHNIVNWTDVPAVDGATLRTTINVGMQDIVDNELNKVLLDCEAQWGAAILMEVSTGDIKAISNLERDSVTGTYGEAMYYVLQGYEPGSVMKVISMTIALEDGFAPNLDQMYNTAPYRYGGGKPIKLRARHQQLPRARAQVWTARALQHRYLRRAAGLLPHPRPQARRQAHHGRPDLRLRQPHPAPVHLRLLQRHRQQRPLCAATHRLGRATRRRHRLAAARHLRARPHLQRKKRANPARDDARRNL